jgi:hypothetical protein
MSGVFYLVWYLSDTDLAAVPTDVRATRQMPRHSHVYRRACPRQAPRRVGGHV